MPMIAVVEWYEFRLLVASSVVTVPHKMFAELDLSICIGRREEKKMGVLR